VWEWSSLSGPEVVLDGLLSTEPMGRPSLRVEESNFLCNRPSSITPAVYMFFAYGYILSPRSLIPLDRRRRLAHLKYVGAAPNIVFDDNLEHSRDPGV
jgi:hypothetical protein